jgi:hypothetical protein
LHGKAWRETAGQLPRRIRREQAEEIPVDGELEIGVKLVLSRRFGYVDKVVKKFIYFLFVWGGSGIDWRVIGGVGIEVASNNVMGVSIEAG